MAETHVKKRNCCLDFVKGIACIFVVFMHCEFPGVLGIGVQAISRFCVPFFFMVSGYFLRKSDGSVAWGKKIRHIAVIAIAATLFYLVVTPIWGDFITRPSLLQIGMWACFNDPYYVSGHLWFLFALLYDYFLFSLLDKLKLTKYAGVIVCIAISLYILCAQGAALAGFYIPKIVYRSFLIEGVAFFGAGFWLRDNREKIRVPNLVNVILLVVSTVLCIGERALLGRDFGVNVFTFVQVFALFMLCLSHPDFGKDKLLTKFGTDFSLWIYILHPAVWHILAMLLSRFGLSDNTAVSYLLPIAVAVLTFAVSAIPVFITSLINKKRG